MRKLYIVKKNYQFDEIIKKGVCIKNKYYIIYYKDNNLPYDRFGISVSKKLGNAVFRNNYKRKIRSIIDNYRKLYINGRDYIIIVRKEAIGKSYEILEKEFIALILKKKKKGNRNEFREKKEI